MISTIAKLCRRAATAALAATLLSCGSASAFEAHNYIDSPFGEFAELGGIAVDQSDGNVYATELNHENGEEKQYHGEVKIFGAEGGQPADGMPSSFTGATSPRHGLGTFNDRARASGVAVDSATGDVYTEEFLEDAVVKYTLNGGNQYEYACEIKYFALAGGNRCLANGGSETENTEPVGSQVEPEGEAVDSAGDVYTDARIGYNSESQGVWEFGAAGEALQVFAPPEETAEFVAIAVAPGGTVYALEFIGEFSSGKGRVFEFKRSSLTGPLEGTPTPIPGIEKATGIAFDGANGELFVDFGSYAEAFNAAHEVVSRFGKGVLTKARSIAVDETTGEVYVAGITAHQIFRFGPGVAAVPPSVDVPPPSATVTRTTALLAATVNTGDATTTWQLQYVAAGEYASGESEPYANGGVTPPVQEPASAEPTAVSVPVKGLQASTTYDYRLIATNEAGTIYGPDRTFTTAAATPPIVETGAAGEVTQTGVLLTGTVNTRELQTSYEFEVGTNANYEGAKLFGTAGTAGTESVSMGLQFLVPGTTYHYRLLASNADGTTYGQDTTFTTPSVTQSITQPVAESFVPVPTETFPSVVGAITKPQSAAKGHKKKTHARKGRGRRTRHPAKRPKHQRRKR